MRHASELQYQFSVSPDDRAHRSITWVLIAVTCGIALARILNCESPDPNRPVPFFSANDRSRWCTIRSLVDYGTFVIDPVIEGENGAWWDSIDKVRHAGPDGQMHYYSSKPTLWPTILAGQYWVLQRITGWTLADDLFPVVRTILILNNLLALGLLIWGVGRLVERITGDGWTRAFTTATVALGTQLTTFSITLNNHLPAAALVAVSLLLADQLMRGRGGLWTYVGLGLFSAGAAAMELPATGWLAIASFIAFGRSFAKSVLAFVPPVALVAAGFWGTNYLAHGEWRPPYDHRGDGPVVANVTGDFAADLDGGSLPAAIADRLSAEPELLGFEIQPIDPVKDRSGGLATATARQWVVNLDQPNQFLIEQTGTDQFAVRRWDNWYDFPGSYWRHDNQRKSAIDRGEPDRVKYLLHLTVGHHGVFSLTPVFLLSVLGVVPLCLVRRFGFRFLALATGALTIVVFAFYLTRPIIDRNYGGMTCAPRWFFWLYPVWVIWMIPVLERIGQRWWGMAIALLLLLVSAASSLYAWTNPWVQPWLYEWMAARGWNV